MQPRPILDKQILHNVMSVCFITSSDAATWSVEVGRPDGFLSGSGAASIALLMFLGTEVAIVHILHEQISLLTDARVRWTPIVE